MTRYPIGVYSVNAFVLTVLKNLFALIISGALLSSCGVPEETAEQTDKQASTTVPVELTEFSQAIELSGELKPQAEAIVATEVGGVISEILAEEGQTVNKGQVVVKLTAQNSLITTQVAAAQTAVSNAQKQLQLQRQQAINNRTAAKIALETAKEHLAKERLAHKTTVKQAEAQLKQAQAAVQLSELRLADNRSAEQELQANLDLQQQQLAERQQNTTASTLVTLRQSITKADQLLGVSPEREKVNDSFEAYFGFRANQAKIDAKNKLKKLLAKLPNIEQSSDTKQLLNFAQDTRALLKKLDTVAQGSLDDVSYGGSSLSQVQQNIAGTRGQLEQSINALTGAQQAINDFKLTAPQQLRTLKDQQRQLQTALQQSQEQLMRQEGGSANQNIRSNERLVTVAHNLRAQDNAVTLTERNNRLNVTAAKSMRDQAKALLSGAQVNYAKLSPKAPLNGVVSRKLVELGDTVTPATPLLQIADISTLRLSGDLPVVVGKQLTIGQTAVIKIDGFEDIEGKISKVHATVNPLTRRLGIEITIDNADQKIPAYLLATAKLKLPTKNTILLPLSAIISYDPPQVLTTNGKREVELGVKQNDKVEILSGLEAGDLVIID